MDWDNDGRLDVVVGDREGNLHFFRRLSFGDVFLSEEPLIAVSGKPIDVGLNSSPCVTDWNSDGLPDLVVGRLEGIPAGVLLFLNQGSAGNPLYTSTDTVLCAGEPLHLYAAYPDMGDLDGDGLDDLIVGNTSGKIPCYLNRGTADDPQFLEFEYLQADTGLINFVTYVRPSICDWNKDGTPDILASTWEGTIHLFLGVPGTSIGHEEPSHDDPVRILECRNPATEVLVSSVELAEAADLVTSLYSLDGRRVLWVDQGFLDRGIHRITLDVSYLPSGTYVFLCSSGVMRASRSVVVF